MTQPELPRDSDGTLSSFTCPGGYPIFYLDKEDSVLCPDCANKSDNEGEVPQFRPVNANINWEDADLSCAQCSEPIPSAYGEDS